MNPMFEGPSFEKKNNTEFVQGEEASVVVEGGEEVTGTVAFVDSLEGGSFVQLLLATSGGDRMFVCQDGVWNEAIAEADSDEEDDGFTAA